MKNKKLIICLLLFLSIVHAGKYGSAFLELGVSARDIAMGGSTGALDSSVTSFYSNPAGLAYVQSPSCGLLYMSQFGLASYNYVGAAFPAGKLVCAANWLHYEVSNIPRRPDYFLSGNYTLEERRNEITSHQGKGFGTFNNYEDGLFFSIAGIKRFQVYLDRLYDYLKIEIPWGINIKTIRKKLDDSSAGGIGADIGGRIRFNFGRLTGLKKIGHLSFGLCARDFTGTNIYWSSKYKDKIPIDIRAALGFEQPVRIIDSGISVSVEHNSKYNEIRYGAEYQFKNILYLRAGYDNLNTNYGCGINVKVFQILSRIDYAFLKHELGQCHRIGLALCF